MIARETKIGLLSKISGSTLLALALSFSASAMDKKTTKQVKGEDTFAPIEKKALKTKAKDKCDDDEQVEILPVDDLCDERVIDRSHHGHHGHYGYHGHHNYVDNSCDSSSCDSSDSSDHHHGHHHHDRVAVCDVDYGYTGFVRQNDCQRQDQFADQFGYEQSACNTLIVGGTFGHRTCAANWNGTHLENVIFHDIKGRSVDIHDAHWKNFVINGDIQDWEFQRSILEHGLFSGNLNNLRFSDAHLIDIIFEGARISRGGFWQSWERTRFDDATLDGVIFRNTDIRAANFRHAHIKQNCRFENVRVHFGTNFRHAYVENNHGQFIKLSKKMIRRLANRYGDDDFISLTGADIYRTCTDH